MNKKVPSSTGTNYIFDTMDVFGKRVYLEEKQFKGHILLGHPELEGNEEALKETVEQPHIVIESKQNPNRFLYIGTSEMATFPYVNIKTVVDHSSTEAGYVVTGLFQKKVDVEKEGKVIYEKEDTDSLR